MSKRRTKPRPILGKIAYEEYLKQFQVDGVPWDTREEYMNDFSATSFRRGWMRVGIAVLDEVMRRIREEVGDGQAQP